MACATTAPPMPTGRPTTRRTPSRSDAESIKDQAIRSFWVDGIGAREIAAQVGLPTRVVQTMVRGQWLYCVRQGWIVLAG